MVPAFGTATLPQNPSIGNGQIPAVGSFIPWMTLAGLLYYAPGTSTSRDLRDPLVFRRWGARAAPAHTRLVRGRQEVLM